MQEQIPHQGLDPQGIYLNVARSYVRNLTHNFLSYHLEDQATDSIEVSSEETNVCVEWRSVQGICNMLHCV